MALDPFRSPGFDPVTDDELTADAVALAADLMNRARDRTRRREHRRQARLARLMSDPGGTRLAFSLADRVLRPFDSRAAARQLAALSSSVSRAPLGITVADGVLLRAAGAAARVAPALVVSLVGGRLRRETHRLVYPAEPEALGRRLRWLSTEGQRPNVNLVGEVVLGWDEANRRADSVEALLRRPDVDCVSVKASSIASGLSLVDFGGSVELVAGPLARLYRVALGFDPPKLVHLDMEEHRDLDLTVAAFTAVLDRAEFARLTAGIALQAYLPDTHPALDELLEFAARRVQRGGVPIRVRLVKGANLAMERVEAEVHGWPLAPYQSKLDTDASYKRLLIRLVEAASAGLVHVGVASHNLFDVALALQLAERQRVDLEIEMLIGMADAQARAVSDRSGRMLVYVPATTRTNFRNALAYLARRLDENASPEGFLRHAPDLVPGSAAWADQARRFAAAMAWRDEVRTIPHQTQDRGSEAPTPGVPVDDFRNEPDTDLTRAANRDWARRALNRTSHPPPSVASETDADAALARVTDARPAWAGLSGAARRQLLERAAEVLALGRGDAVAVMAAEAGKTFAESDPEVSEAVDYARWYAREAEELDRLHAAAPALRSEAVGLVLVASPWNFPYAVPAGGVLAALAAGNVVLLKPSPETRATAALLIDQLHEAGVPPHAVELVATEDGAAGQRLVTDRRIGAIVLTGSLETARMFRRWIPGRRLLAETNGKNALVVTATADVDQAVRDLVKSAFGHAGQKCSSSSLAIVDASIHDRSPFLRQLADAVRSLRVGPATDLATEIGPIVGPFTAALERALTRLNSGESWLVEPRPLDSARRIWAPGVLLGVRPGSWAHLTEWFGPVLGVMRAGGLEEALRWQNAVPYGLTAGLHSLDPHEHRQWADSVEAGNLYINRHTTGAIVGRQPFGGWKGSALGPTAKTGGPNYLVGLRRWWDATTVSVVEARQSYEEWWRTHFSQETELAELASEANVLRYRSHPDGVELRVGVGVGEDDVRKAEAAARVTGTPVRVSRADEETATAFAARLRAQSAGGGAGGDGGGAAMWGRGGSNVRLRVLGRPEPVVLEAAAELGLTVFDEPVCSHGRVELLRWLREQVVSRSLHRYGNVVYDR